MADFISKPQQAYHGGNGSARNSHQQIAGVEYVLTASISVPMVKIFTSQGE
jgi:hypothetical protein